MIKIHTFGDWDIKKNGISILEPKASQQRLLKLLKYFLTFEGKKVTPERIYEDLLIDTTSYNPRNIIRTQISRLRALFEDYDFYSIEYIAGYYVLKVKKNCTLDFKEFEKLIEEGNALMDKDPVNAIILLKRGLSLYKGEYLPELYDEDWVIGIRNRYNRLYLRGLYNYIRLLKEQEDYNGIIEITEKGIQYKPYEEMVNAYFIEALMKTGQREYAISHYEYYTTKIHNDLRIAPSNYMKELYSILQHPGYRDKYAMFSDITSIESIFQRNCKCINEELCNVERFNLLYNDESGEDITLALKKHYLVLITLEENMDPQLQGIDMKENMAIINRILQSNLRNEDRLFQCKQGPMLILFHDVNLEVLQMIAERIQNRFREEVKNEDILLNIKYKSV